MGELNEYKTVVVEQYENFLSYFRKTTKKEKVVIGVTVVAIFVAGMVTCAIL